MKKSISYLIILLMLVQGHDVSAQSDFPYEDITPHFIDKNMTGYLQVDRAGVSGDVRNPIFSNITFLGRAITVSYMRVKLVHDGDGRGKTYFQKENTIGWVDGEYYNNIVDEDLEYTLLSNDTIFLGRFLFFPEVTTISGWKEVIHQRNNTQVGDWNITTREPDHYLNPSYVEVWERSDGSKITYEIGLKTHAPKYIKFLGPVVNSSQPNVEIDMVFFTEANYVTLYGPIITETGVEIRRIMIDPRVIVDVVVLLAISTGLIIFTSKKLKKRKTNEFDDYAATLRNDEGFDDTKPDV